VVLAEDMIETDKKKILSTEMNRYKKLRIQIAQSKAEKKKNKIKRQEPGITTPGSFFQTPGTGKEGFSNTEQFQESSTEALSKAVEEIKQYIHTEIEVLKAEIKALF